MGKTVLFLLLAVLAMPPASPGADFLGAPLVPGAETVEKTPARLEMTAALSHDEIVAFYRDALKDLPDIKFRNWKDSTYIEDDGRLQWHSITVSKEGGPPTKVIIVKDNWTWIIGTLILRFVGVFAVLLILFLGMTVSGRLISASIRRAERRKEEAAQGEAP